MRHSANLPEIDHREGLRVSSMLTRWYREMHEPKAMNVTPRKLITLLNKAKVKFILMGAHGISGWLPEARATQDVDFLVHEPDQEKAVTAILKAYPKLEMIDLPAVTRFRDPATDKVVIDLMKPVEELYLEAFNHTVAVGKTHRVPALELALACKFAAMTSEHREDRKKMLDHGDFIGLVVANPSRIREGVLFSFGEMVRNGGGSEILQMIKDIKNAPPPGEARG